jgi:hypothetical protein
MLFPMLGILFLAASGGIFAGIVSLVFKRSRMLAAYFFLCPSFAALLSFTLFWGGGLLIEHLLGATRWSTLAALLGYAGSLVLGAFCGFVVARGINKRVFG